MHDTYLEIGLVSVTVRVDCLLSTAVWMNGWFIATVRMIGYTGIANVPVNSNMLVNAFIILKLMSGQVTILLIKRLWLCQKKTSLVVAVANILLNWFFFNGKNSFLVNAQVNGFVSDVHVNGNVAKV